MDGMPWVEKYRPETLSDVVGQKEITKRLESYVKQKNMPHLLFSGPAGIGKTSCAVALAKELFGKDYPYNFLELNASDSRGIDVVRGTIKEFARTLAFGGNFKIIFLDESDALTTDAQQALRRTMEKYSRTCRFVFSANYSSKILEPILSRCVVFRFRPLNAKDIDARLKKIALEEKLELVDGAIDAINYVCEGDLRKAINILQASASLGKKIDSEIIYNVASRARPEEIKQLIKAALGKDFLKTRALIDALLYEHGMSGEDIITQTYRELVNLPENELDSKTKIELIDVIGEYNFRMVEGANERIQLEALFAQFMKFK